jgi:cytochrome c oxidase cbb3-type subunit 3
MTNVSGSIMFSLVIGFAGLAGVTAAQAEDPGVISAALTLRAEGLVLSRCAVCHSTDLIEQQRLPRVRWEATVEKMKHWGAEISRDEADLLVRYLSARYHLDALDRLPPLDSELRKAERLTQEPVTEGPLTGVSARGASIFEHKCQACHGAMAMGGMGPRLVKAPILKHESLFRETVLHGRGAMPAWGAVLSPQDIADTHAWLVTR